jgi:hypothetical protein
LPSAGVFRAALDALSTQHGIHSSARHVAEWITRFAQPGDGWVRAATSKPALPLPPEQVTVAQRKRSSPSAKLKRSSEQQQLATEIWGEDMPVMTHSPAGPDFNVQVARPSSLSPLTKSLPPLVPQSQPMPLVNVPMYTPTQHPRAKASRKAIAILVGLATILAVLVTILILKPKKQAAPAKASVHFVVEPKDSKITVAGKPVGEAVELEAGAYAVTIEHAAFKTWTRDIVVKAGEGQTVNVSLEHEHEQVAVAPPKPTEEIEIEMPATPTRKPAEKKKTDKKRPEVAETKPPKQEDPPKPEVAETKPAEPPKQEDPPKPIEKPVVEPPKPEKPKVTPGVSASAVTKLSGEIPKLTSTVGASNGDARVKLCIDESGKVTSAKVVKSTASIASELQSALMSWRYKPYVNQDGETQAVCFLLQLRLVFKRGG